MVVSDWAETVATRRAAKRAKVFIVDVVVVVVGMPLHEGMDKGTEI